ncbi:MAG: Flp pilus assembly protein CpaB [Hyphomicrobiaceae bacterium]|nr:Flp pilus assembly protein CpaB [Hyphomicrobiaceae bacterium]
MKPARLIGIGVAAGAGLLAFLAAQTMVTPPPADNAAPQAAAPEITTTEILVARHDISIGGRLTPGSMDWQEWPAANVSPSYITRDANPDALERYDGAIATQPIESGEPMRASILAAQGRGFMAAILPSGMRAISVRVKAESRAAGFILPNDRIDVILTRQRRGAAPDGSDLYDTQTILSNVRVLAIDQTFEERDGEQFVTGEIATLELSPTDSELLAMANQMGEISLALRSIADLNEELEGADGDVARRLRGGGGGNTGTRVIRYGIAGGGNH